MSPSRLDLSKTPSQLRDKYKLQNRFPSSCLSPNWCILFKQHSESMEHLFITCPLIKSIWLKFYNYINATALYPSDLDSALNNPNSKKNTLLSNIAGATIWCTWLERNSRTFHGKEKSQWQLWEDIISLASMWCTKSKTFCNYSTSSIALNWEVFL